MTYICILHELLHFVKMNERIYFCSTVSKQLNICTIKSGKTECIITFCLNFCHCQSFINKLSRQIDYLSTSC